jgi:predicted molibdopterin-dependent oxidoreductase YjgC
VAAGRVAATSIDQFLNGQPVVGERSLTNVLMRGLDEQELAALFRRIEKSARTPGAQIGIDRRQTTFDEIEAALTPEQAATEAQRCLTCGCRKAEGCRVRQYATEYGADPYRFEGERRRFAQDLSHPEIIYEPGKCIMCDACVRVAAESKEALGLTLVGRGFQVAVGVPFDGKLSDALREAAKRCAEVCPTGALALRSQRACDLCEGCALAAAND